MKHEKVEFKVIEDKQIVVAMIKDIQYDAVHAFNNKFLPHANSDMYMNCFYNEKFFMPHALKAVARCHPDDEFSVEKGKQIALKKLTEKYNASLDRHLGHIYKHLDKCLDNMAIYLAAHKVI